MLFAALAGFKLWLAVAGLALLGCVVLAAPAKRNKLPLPPSPQGWPIIGNLIDVVKSGKFIHLLVTDWAQKYGDVIRVKVGPTSEIFLASDEAVETIFNKDTKKSSERPDWIVGKKLMTNQWSLLLMDAQDPRWRLHRRLTNQNLTSIPRADAGLPFLYFESLKFMHELSHDPDAGTERQELWTKVGRYIYSTFCQQLFGLELERSRSDAMDHIFQSGLEEIMSTNSGAYIVDVFPILNRLPAFLRTWEPKAKKRYADDMEFVRKRADYVKTLLDRNLAPDAFLPKLLSDPKSEVSADEAAYLALQLVLGASDTSRMTQWGFLEQMMMFPEVQAKTRRLIDEACGDRLPVWEDLERIPYIRYVMKESWRTRAPVCLGLPHLTNDDIVYKGILIPKGSILRPNVWAIGHDPVRHPNPDRFIPERWEGDNLNTQESALLPDYTKRDHFAFGGGRRMCPGVHVADRNFAIAIMRLLWGFTIQPKPGTKLPIDMKEFAHDVPGVAAPDMPITITVRPERKALIDQYYNEALRSRPQYGNLDLDHLV